MKRDYKKHFIILLICALGMYVSGKNLITIESIRTLLDGLNAMTFFTCFFPFVINALILVRKSLRMLIKIATH
ncbi:hypothetical protein BW723_10640 [Polaribacter reichenbachii]|uniref:Uncharacterized protein n=1 Tax=Polaribacter reichenbachii TaxID=996801 RepID=A0A1B8TQM0_9FLAO|nr:hypothetical protein [Polaribacter reichenbachii]APZ46713.1 hypothetical protein BW723_10640 [Polaribacter reichenbachii]AUC17356.1 hypothetical protein BTO17_01085 [Polaribacter reichenbachii]OBY61768.1 hypothetical protein LPB301_17115 [Polaribacter reichenbachii]